MGGREKTGDVRRWLGGCQSHSASVWEESCAKITESWSFDFCSFLPSSPKLIRGRRKGGFNNGRRGCCNGARGFIGWSFQPRGCGSHPLILVLAMPLETHFQVKCLLLQVESLLYNNPFSTIILHISDESSDNNNSKHLYMVLCGRCSSKCFIYINSFKFYNNTEQYYHQPHRKLRHREMRKLALPPQSVCI